MNRTRDNEKGIVLITTLMLMVLGFGVVATLLSMVSYGTRVSGMEHRYTVALEASKGGSDYMVNMIRNDIFTPPVLAGVTTSGPSGSACLQQKISTVGTSCTPPCTRWSSCSTQATNPDPTIAPDARLTLGDYNVFIKIIDTRQSDTDFYYTVNIRSQGPTPREHAEITFLYQLEQ